MIVGEKILLRPIDMNDINTLFKIHNDIKFKKLAMFHPFPVTFGQDKKWVDDITSDTSNKSIYFAIEEKGTKLFAGYASLRNINWVNRNCYFGIVIVPDLQGKGIGKEATQLIINYAIKNINLKKIQLEVISENQNAIKLYKDSGFIEEGTLRKQYYFEGFYYDVLLMAYFNKNDI